MNIIIMKCNLMLSVHHSASCPVIGKSKENHCQILDFDQNYFSHPRIHFQFNNTEHEKNEIEFLLNSNSMTMQNELDSREILVCLTIPVQVILYL